MQQAKHVKSSFNDKMDNLIDGYTVTAIDYTNNFEESFQCNFCIIVPF